MRASAHARWLLRVRARALAFAAGGNRKLPELGTWLKGEIGTYFAKIKMPVTVKYIDPSYMIRSVPANASDAVYCLLLAQNAVHGAMVRSRSAASRARAPCLNA